MMLAPPIQAEFKVYFEFYWSDKELYPKAHPFYNILHCFQGISH